MTPMKPETLDARLQKIQDLLISFPGDTTLVIPELLGLIREIHDEHQKEIKALKVRIDGVRSGNLVFR